MNVDLLCVQVDFGRLRAVLRSSSDHTRGDSKIMQIRNVNEEGFGEREEKCLEQ